MYRLLFTLVCIGTVSSAPQDSKITYVKRHIDSDPVDNRKHELRENSREEKVEIVPLTISVSSEDLTEANDPEKPRDTIIDELYKQNNNNPDYNYSDRIYSIKTKPKKSNQSTTTEISLPPEVIEETSSINPTENSLTPEVTEETRNPEAIPAESKQTDTVVKTDNTTQNINATTEVNTVQTNTTQNNNTTTEITVPSSTESEITTKYDEAVTTEIDEETTKFTTTTKATTTSALPKLSYLKNKSGSFSRNLITSPGKRKFRSRCRCEKIWNCAKLQISVPRCPDEYFLCCA